MNYDCDRPTSRVSKPPGGGSSNIFGDAEPSLKLANCKSNPSFQSSVFSDVETQHSVEQKHKTDSAKISNVSMFNPEVRPHTAHYTRGTGLERSSNILKNFSYPVDPRFEPGVQSRPKTAYKPVNPTTMSHIFENGITHSNDFKRNRNKNLTFQSSIFNPQQKVPIFSKPISKTFQTTVGKPEKKTDFVKRKLSTEIYSQSAMTGSSCDINGEENTTIMSSGFVKTPLKAKGLKSFDLLKEKGNPLFKSCGDLITTSGDSVVHFECQENKQLSNSYKSDGFKNRNNMSEKDSLKLWSCDLKPSLMTSGMGKNSQSYKSHVFESDEKSHNSCIWSSDFKKASIQIKQSLPSNNTVSTVFLTPEPLVVKKSDHISKTYLSTVFT